jgi:hypothetical protein
MYSGLALLVDVYRPDTSNGYGVVEVNGSGWHSPLGYAAPELKERSMGLYRDELLRAGYVLFVINHR